MIVDKNRSPHFKFDDHSAQIDPTIMTSVTHIHHDYKGNPTRAFLDPEIKKSSYLTVLELSGNPL